MPIGPCGPGGPVGPSGPSGPVGINFPAVNCCGAESLAANCCGAESLATNCCGLLIVDLRSGKYDSRYFARMPPAMMVGIAAGTSQLKQAYDPPENF